ncbi:MAG: hypothetical protein NUW23_10735 [Firmicutes bacterium]|nr:hypothetical protein [Bacillota bacterium]
MQDVDVPKCLLLASLALGVEYGLKSMVSGMPRLAELNRVRPYVCFRLCAASALAALLALFFGAATWILPAALAYTAIAWLERPIEALRVRLERTTGSRLAWLQLMPMALIAVAPLLLWRVGLQPPGFGPLLAGIYRLVNAAFTMPGVPGITVSAVLAGTAAYVFLGEPANYVVRCLLGRETPLSPGLREGPRVAQLDAATAEPQGLSGSGAECPDYDTLRAGRAIGTLERWIMATFIALGQYAAMGLVLTAKSIVRYSRIEHDPGFAEYYLLGTLYSMLIALLIGLALRGGM